MCAEAHEIMVNILFMAGSGRMAILPCALLCTWYNVDSGDYNNLIRGMNSRMYGMGGEKRWKTRNRKKLF